MGEEAILLTTRGVLSPEDRKIARVLEFFDVRWTALPVAEFGSYCARPGKNAARLRLFCSSDAFLRLLLDLQSGQIRGDLWRERIHSAFVFAGADTDSLECLAKLLIHDEKVVISETASEDGEFSMSDRLEDFCGVMSALRLTASKIGVRESKVLQSSRTDGVAIIWGPQGPTFVKGEFEGVPVFFSTCAEIVDIDAPLTTQNFNVRDHFLSAVPLVLYAKWAFAKTCRKAPATTGCLIIDDPLLKPRHGFVDFQELLMLMEQHGFSTNIAFIPWNWRRSAPNVIRIFRENADKFSLSVHGCDHTAGEFGSPDRGQLYLKVQRALERMKRHESYTKIHHDRVMVFPQGVFSRAAISALKHSDLVAAVNNDVVSADPEPPAITVADVWDTAVMRYSDFAIFTRRYPWEGVENVAFDFLLGKPALIVIHHDYCNDGCERLIQFIQRLNALRPQIKWCSLGDAVQQACQQRDLALSIAEVEMYAAELLIENRSQWSRRFLVRKRECDASAVREIRAGGVVVPWHSEGNYVGCTIELGPNESRWIKISYQRLSETGPKKENIPYRTKVMARRYLSEFRDNHVVKHRQRPFRPGGKRLS